MKRHSDSLLEQPPNKKLKVAENDTKLVVLMQGCPGLGKTTLGPYVVDVLQNHGLAGICIEQDQFGGNGKRCRKAFKELLASGKHQVVIVNRNNAVLQEYEKYLEISRSHNFKILALYPQEYKKPELLAIIWHGVLTRRNHPTFDKLTPDRKMSVARACLSRLTPAQEADQTHSISWIHPNFELYEHSLHSIQSRTPYEDLIHILQLTTFDYKQFRRPLQDIANDVALKIRHFIADPEGTNNVNVNDHQGANVIGNQQKQYFMRPFIGSAHSARFHPYGAPSHYCYTGSHHPPYGYWDGAPTVHSHGPLVPNMYDQRFCGNPYPLHRPPTTWPQPSASTQRHGVSAASGAVLQTGQGRYYTTEFQDQNQVPRWDPSFNQQRSESFHETNFDLDSGRRTKRRKIQR